MFFICRAAPKTISSVEFAARSQSRGRRHQLPEKHAARRRLVRQLQGGRHRPRRPRRASSAAAYAARAPA